MKNTFSAYVRLSQTRTRESMQAAFHGVRAGRSGPGPGRRKEGTPKHPCEKGDWGDGVGAIIRLSRALACNADVTDFRRPSRRRAGVRTAAARPVPRAAGAAAGERLVRSAE